MKSTSDLKHKMLKSNLIQSINPYRPLSVGQDPPHLWEELHPCVVGQVSVPVAEGGDREEELRGLDIPSI